MTPTSFLSFFNHFSVSHWKDFWRSNSSINVLLKYRLWLPHVLELRLGLLTVPVWAPAWLAPSLHPLQVHQASSRFWTLLSSLLPQGFCFIVWLIPHPPGLSPRPFLQEAFFDLLPHSFPHLQSRPSVCCDFLASSTVLLAYLVCLLINVNCWKSDILYTYSAPYL